MPQTEFEKRPISGLDGVLARTSTRQHVVERLEELFRPPARDLWVHSCSVYRRVNLGSAFVVGAIFLFGEKLLTFYFWLLTFSTETVFHFLVTLYTF